MSGISGVGVSPGLAYAQQVQQMINNDSSQQQPRAGDAASDRSASAQSASSADMQAARKVTPEAIEKVSQPGPLQETPGRINLYA